ncbi:MAG TPA: GNAT family N-acetyltransferase [Jatrophihabitans sp.]|jgi:predicted acetyltransferase
MDVEIRYARPDELAAIVDLDGASFGAQYTPDDIQDVLLDIELDTMLVALDAGRIVGASCEVPFRMTLPGGETDALGLTWVSVEMTHRRRGILRALMDTQLRAAAGRHVPVSVLSASEASIYGRYGFGVATRTRHTVIDRRAAQLIRPLAEHGVTRMSTDEVRGILPGLYERWRRQTPGGLNRNEKRWRLQLLEREWSRQGRSELFHLVHADGYVSYRIARGNDELGHRNTCAVVDYVVCSPRAHAALWSVLLGMDLVVTVESHRIPLDDPLPHLLTDPRQVTTTAVTDGLWTRPIDVAALLAARGYALDLDVTLGVRDPLLGDAGYRLVGGPGGVSCERSGGDPDVTFDVPALGAVVLGGVRIAELRAAGRISGDAAALSRLDRAFLADVSPQPGTYF